MDFTVDRKGFNFSKQSEKAWFHYVMLVVRALNHFFNFPSISVFLLKVVCQTVKGLDGGYRANRYGLPFSSGFFV